MFYLQQNENFVSYKKSFFIKEGHFNYSKIAQNWCVLKIEKQKLF